MSARTVLASLGAAAVAAIVVYLWAQPRPPAAQPPVSQSEPATGAATQSPAERESVAIADKPDSTDTPQNGTEPIQGMTEAEAKRQRRIQELERAAEERFQQAVRTDGLDPSDVSPSVRAMFSSVTLQPVVDPSTGTPGYIEGMRIAEIAGENPLAKAGFSPGDRITRIDGKPLNDPAQIAHLFTALGGRFEVCAAREGNRRCRMIALEDTNG